MPYVSFFDQALILVAGGLALWLVMRRSGHLDRLVKSLESGWRVPALVGTFASLVTLWVWWPSRSVPVISDEAAYLLQAELLVQGRFTAPAPLEPQLSQQAAVIVTPVLAPKTMPGHALLLAPGVAIGAPWLMPVLMTGLTAMLILLLTRVVGGGGAGTLAAILWITAPGVLRWQPSYFSEVSSTILMLFGWLMAWKWWRTSRSGPLVLCALAYSFMAITRPLTAIAQALPVAVLILVWMVRRRAWRQLGLAMAIGVLPLLLVPIQSRAVTGEWDKTPWALYSEQYATWDRLGFGLDQREPTMTLQPVIAAEFNEFVLLHGEHHPRALPGILRDRVMTFWRQQMAGWRRWLLPTLLLLGLLANWRLGSFMFAAAASQFGFYLVYAHKAMWTIYYAELVPMIGILAALGAGWLMSRGIPRHVRERASPAVLGMAIIVAVVAVPTFARQRASHLAMAMPWLRLDQALASTGPGRRIVFVHQESIDANTPNLVRNSVSGGVASLQLMYQPGSVATRELRRRYPDRQFWRYDARTGKIKKLR